MPHRSSDMRPSKLNLHSLPDRTQSLTPDSPAPSDVPPRPSRSQRPTNRVETPRIMYTSSSGSPITPNSASHFPFSSSTSLPIDITAADPPSGAASIGMSMGLSAGYVSPPLSGGTAGGTGLVPNPSYSGDTGGRSGTTSPNATSHRMAHSRQGSSSGKAPSSTSPAHRYTSVPYPRDKDRTQSDPHARPDRADSSSSIGAERPQRPALHRNRTSASSGGKDDGKEAQAKSAAKRASKACNNCRLRRRKCSMINDQGPCKACVDIGLGGSCTFRAKARPNRALPKVIDSGLNFDSLVLDQPLLDAPMAMMPGGLLSPHSVGLSHAHPVRDIDATVELWLAEQGQPMSLSLYDPPSLLADLGTKPLPPLLSPAAETHAVHSFLESTARYFAFLHGPRMLEMLRLHHATPTHQGFFVSQHQPDVTSPGGLRPDERAMVYAAVCLGRFKEIPPISNGPGVQVPAGGSRHNSTSASASGSGPSGAVGGGIQANIVGMTNPGQPFSAGVKQEHKTVPLSVRLREMREDSGYFCRAMLELQKWGGASLTALGTLHCLHLFTLLSGGAAEMRDVLGRMAWQIRELGLNSADSAAMFAAEDRVDRLFYTTLHEDNWFATLLDAPPFILANTYDPSMTPLGSWDKADPNAQFEIDGERWIDQHPCVVQLTMFENELLTMVHTTPELSQAFLFDIEARLADWMKAFREEQLAVPSWMLHTYANIRFHWLRIMLRAPLLSNPHFRLASLATVTRSASQILLSYHSFADTASFLPTWGECRRILTAAHLVVLGHWEGEFLMAESEFLGGVAVALLDKLEAGCPFLIGAKDRLMMMFGLLGIAPRKPFGMGPPPPVDPPGPSTVRSQDVRITNATPQGSSYPSQTATSMPQSGVADYTTSGFGMSYRSLQQQVPQDTSHHQQIPISSQQPLPTSAPFVQNGAYGTETRFLNTHQTHSASSAGLDQTIFAPPQGQQAFTPFVPDNLAVQPQQYHGQPSSNTGSPTGQGGHNMLMSVAVPRAVPSMSGHEQDTATEDKVLEGEGEGEGQMGWLEPWMDAMLWTGTDGHGYPGVLEVDALGDGERRGDGEQEAAV